MINDYEFRHEEITIERAAYQRFHSNIDIAREAFIAKGEQYSNSVGDVSYRNSTSLADYSFGCIPRQTPSGNGNSTLVPGFIVERLGWAGTAMLVRDFQRHAVERAIGESSKMPDRERVETVGRALRESSLGFSEGSPEFESAISSAAGKCAAMIRSIRINHPTATVPDIMDVLNRLSMSQVNAAVAWIRSGEESAGDRQDHRNSETDPSAGSTSDGMAEVNPGSSGQQDHH